MFNKKSEDKKFIANLLVALEEEEVITKIKEIIGKDELIAGDSEIEVREYKTALEEKESQILDLRSELKNYKASLNNKGKEIESLKSNLASKASRVDELEFEISSKQRELETKNRKIEELKNENSSLKAQGEELRLEKSRLHNEVRNQQEEIRRLKDRFKGVGDIYKVYLNLSSGNKSSLQGIFKGDSIEEFIYCGVQYDNLESLWEYIKREVIEDKNSEINKLDQIFTYFFAAHNRIYDSPLYKRQEVKVGESIDEDKHIRGRDSKVIGEIKEVLFRGYINLKTDRVIKKSVVRA
ncbi:hypothetical protein MWH25_02355 [Natroniella acetigena]|uniref:hypothetical protein n=1 Tax=Natroniella acetigena TaxID=52004 RepID=UPI00200AC1DF|nr:hypothetical protein [Natroniella acetigena]MCK8826591.1 hypothetical protein [Natroniella acetigena]